MRMKVFLILALAAGCALYVWLSRQSTPEKLQESAALKYANSLQEDVRRAEEAKIKADAATRRMQDAQDRFRQSQSE